jgi:hypothetical protein
MSKLRGKVPTIQDQRLKVLFYGGSGVGKTMAGISFPKPYVIDTEGSTNKPQYIKAIEKAGGAALATLDFDEIVNEIQILLTEKHEYKTLVIDSLTPTYNDLLDKAEKKHGSEFGRHYGEANKKMKHLLNLLFRIDMNVIITSHSKNEYGANLSVLGQTFDCYKKLDYLFDLVLEIQMRGKQRTGVVKKSRIETFELGEAFPFSYDTVADKYGRDVLEREAKAEELATVEQVAHLKRLIELYKEPEETVQKWLDKAKAASFAEMSKDIISKIITHMENRAKPQQSEKDVINEQL